MAVFRNYGLSVGEVLTDYANLKKSAIRRYKAGESIGEVAADLGVSHQAVYLWLREADAVRDKKEAAALRTMKRLLTQRTRKRK
jgi:uncharacterized protein (DUF433 family)